MEIIKIENLNFSYNKKKILKNINLEISENKFIGILGPNGCGKTTLLKNILGYLKGESGKIFLNRKEVSEYSQKEKAKVISFVPQKSQMISPVTVEEFVIMGRLPYLKNSLSGYSKEDKETAFKYIEELGLEKFIKRSILTLSGGEFQKVLLARAFTQETKIVLLDEPTSALDLNHALEIMERVKKFTVQKKITAAGVFHDLNLAAMFCDEIILMKEGTVFAEGTPKEVFTKENMKEIYNLECEIFFRENEIPYIIPLKK